MFYGDTLAQVCRYAGIVAITMLCFNVDNFKRHALAQTLYSYTILAKVNRRDFS